MSVYPPNQLLNAWSSFHEPWYVYHDTRASSNADFINPSLTNKLGLLTKKQKQISIASVTRQRLGKYFAATTNTHTTMEEFLDASNSLRSVECQRTAGDCV
jgi:hypothetical protein